MNVPLSPMMSMPPSSGPLLDLDKPSAKPRGRSSEMKVLANGNVVKLQKTRQRRILSCVHCHSKKIKCSRVHPMCDNCEKLGIECKYFINQRVSRGGRKLKLELESSSMSVMSVNDTASVKREPLEGLQSLNRSSVSEFSDMNASPMSPALSGASGTSVVDDDKKEMSQKKTESPVGDGSLNFLQMGTHTHQNSPMAKAMNMMPFSPDNNLLQAPIVNSMSNNITNNFFNTNYGNAVPNGEELYSFNLSSFTFNTGPDALLNNPHSRLSSYSTPTTKAEPEIEKKPETQNTMESPDSNSNINGMLKGLAGLAPHAVTNFVDGPSNAVPTTPFTATNMSARNSQPNNPGLHNSLNAYSSNPAMTINYLYGTNTYYDNDNLLTDLITHLPTSRERSFELIDRYINSVHILLPVMVNLNEFIKEHERFWDHFDPHKNHSPATASTASSGSAEDFNFLQFYTLYFPVLYASTISEFEEYDNLLLNQDINKYLKGFNKVCQYYNYPHGLKSIPLLLGNVIIQSTSPNPSTMEMSQIIRYAKFLHFHKDPLVSLRITDWKIIKFRRMLWWVIFGLDGLSSHNFCLPPVCKFDDFNVLMPDYEDPVFDEQGNVSSKKLNVTMLAMTIKFKYDRILSELVYQLHNGLATNITSEEINEVKSMIVNLFHFIHKSIIKMNNFYKASPPTTVQEMNLVNFIKNHSWSFADRATMLLHKKILLHDPAKDKNDDGDKGSYELMPRKERGGVLSLSQFEDTFGRIQETNIIRNFDNSSISQLRFNQNELFAYENMHNNLIPSILHNLNDFLKYNDFIKFGKYNWYIKRTIPLDSIILLFVIICVKFKYEFMTPSELVIYVKLINKALFILNRKYFKNEKYKRMLSLTNLTWEFILKKYNVIKLLNLTNEKRSGKIEFFDYQVSGFMNMSELFNVMNVPQPALISNGVSLGRIQCDDVPMRDLPQKWEAEDSEYESPENAKSLTQSIFPSQLVEDKKNDTDLQAQKLELLQLNEKLYYDLRNNFVDINDYCTFYSSLENVLHELMDYVNSANGTGPN